MSKHKKLTDDDGSATSEGYRQLPFFEVVKGPCSGNAICCTVLSDKDLGL